MAIRKVDTSSNGSMTILEEPMMNPGSIAAAASKTSDSDSFELKNPNEVMSHISTLMECGTKTFQRRNFSWEESSSGMQNLLAKI